MPPIRFGIQTPQEGATYETLATHWREADALGFDSIWRNDHFYPVGVTHFIGLFGRVEDLRGTRLFAERVLPAFR